MMLPCRHVFKVREHCKLNLFAPSLYSKRWTVEYYKKNHRLFTQVEKSCEYSLSNGLFINGELCSEIWDTPNEESGTSAC